MTTLDISRYKQFICGYVHMYLHSKHGTGELLHPDGGMLSHILKYGVIKHHNISLTYCECYNNGDNLGAFLCLIMLCYDEAELERYYWNDWQNKGHANSRYLKNKWQ